MVVARDRNPFTPVIGRNTSGTKLIEADEQVVRSRAGEGKGDDEN